MEEFVTINPLFGPDVTKLWNFTQYVIKGGGRREREERQGETGKRERDGETGRDREEREGGEGGGL